MEEERITEEIPIDDFDYLLSETENQRDQIHLMDPLGPSKASSSKANENTDESDNRALIEENRSRKQEVNKLRYQNQQLTKVNEEYKKQIGKLKKKNITDKEEEVHLGSVSWLG